MHTIYHNEIYGLTHSTNISLMEIYCKYVVYSFAAIAHKIDQEQKNRLVIRMRGIVCVGWFFFYIALIDCDFRFLYPQLQRQHPQINANERTREKKKRIRTCSPNWTEFKMDIVIAANEFFNQHFVSDDKQREHKNQRIKTVLRYESKKNECKFAMTFSW